MSKTKQKKGHFFTMWSRKSEGISGTDAMEENRPLMGLPSNPNIDPNITFGTDP